ncbi:MAG: hypothetical protein IKU62_08445, partial [Ruminiclostridium sp.]|nr:hypothetical protein [Ruminiclostridium sp.]
MKKNLKKWMALMLALSMCASLMTMPALAAEGDPATESVITIPEAPGDGSAEKPAVTVDVTIQENGSVTTTTTQTEWSGETKTGDENNGSTTTVTGSQTATETVEKDSKDRVTKETGHTEGSETTKTETTKTETKEEIISTSEKNIEYGSETPLSPENPEIQWEDDKDADKNNWVEGEETFDDWKPETTNTTEGAGEDGWKTTTKPTETENTNLDIPDPLDKIDVTLKLEPGNKDSETITVSTQTILAENSNMFDLSLIEAMRPGSATPITEDNQGSERIPIYQEGTDTIIGYKIKTTGQNQTIVKEPVYQEGTNTIIGYTITTTTTTTTPGTTGETQRTEEREEADPVGSEPVIPGTWAKDVEDFGTVTETTDGDKVTKSATNEKGVTVEMTKAPIYGEDGKTIIGYTITKTTTTPKHSEVPSQATGETTTVPAEPETTFTLPVKPEPSEKTENGVTTKVVVEDVIDEDGNHVGYKTITTKSEGGKVVYTAAEIIYGTTTT